jgi:hypothetical protein
MVKLEEARDLGTDHPRYLEAAALYKGARSAHYKTHIKSLYYWPPSRVKESSRPTPSLKAVLVAYII